ncbi:MAG: sugar phosphate isomerase/epimerase [Candidatus Aminicenantes bacterium]|nr:sugar phosphate isomerase/epimerase [Candidatus Aminicenantes bacterium]
MRRTSRRDFLKWAGAGAAWAAVGQGRVETGAAWAAGRPAGTAALGAREAGKPAATVEGPAADAGAGTDPFSGRLGLASYTTRELSLDETLKWAKRLGLTHVCLKDFHLPMKATAAQFDEVKAKFTAAGLDFHAVGVVYMKTPAEVEAGFLYARNAGVRMIVGVPNHELLDLVEGKVKETGIRLAIHNHGPTDRLYPTGLSALRKIENRDPGLGICLDIGHSFRAGEDPAEAFRACGARILEVHLKDIDVPGEKGGPVEMGRGRIDLPAFVRAVARSEYQGYFSFEYEKDGSNPIPGLAESVGYFRGLSRGVRSCFMAFFSKT